MVLVADAARQGSYPRVEPEVVGNAALPEVRRDVSDDEAKIGVVGEVVAREDRLERGEEVGARRDAEKGGGMRVVAVENEGCGAGGELAEVGGELGARVEDGVGEGRGGGAGGELALVRPQAPQAPRAPTSAHERSEWVQVDH